MIDKPYVDRDNSVSAPENEGTLDSASALVDAAYHRFIPCFGKVLFS
jgi:hypothetical protein